MKRGIPRFVGLHPACENLAPFTQALRRRWAVLRSIWMATARRFATPLVVVLGFLLQAPPATASEIAITFDDLPSHGALPAGTSRGALVDVLIATLKRHGVAGAVGFVNAGKMSLGPEYSAIVATWVAAGYSIGNHTLSHVDLDRTEVADYLADVDRNDTILASESRGQPFKLFRYPFLHEGETPQKRDAVRAALHARGYRVAPVTVHFHDWAWNDAYVRCVSRGDAEGADAAKRGLLRDADAALEWSEQTARLLIGRPVKHIMLLHLAAIHAAVLDDLLDRYARRGAQFVPVANAITDPIYEIDPGVVGYGNFLLQLARATGRPAERLRVQAVEDIQRTCR
jgi:peptidoglycan-N-acetylglucosamine deacetylase